MSGVEVGITNLSKSFGSANIWSDVTLTLPLGEISVLLGPSGTGKSVLLKSIIGLRAARTPPPTSLAAASAGYVPPAS